MGLDNGIQITKYSEAAFADFPDEWVHKYNYGEGTQTIIEPVYMRKWWGVRNNIVGYLAVKYKLEKDQYEWDLTINDLKAIKEIFIDWLDEDKWESEGSSIWSWDEGIPDQIGRHIAAINKLIRLMEEHPGMLVQFYDSY